MKLSNQIRSDLRFFAFFVGNGTLNAGIADIDVDFEGILLCNDEALGMLFSVYLYHYTSHNEISAKEAIHHASMWFLNQYVNKEQFDYPFSKDDSQIIEYSTDPLDVIAYFALQLGNGDLSKEIALPFDYRIYLYQGGSLLEGIFAVLTNCMIITDTNEVLNRHHAIQRAIQYLKSTLDSTYHVTPPFESWELELM